MTELFTIEAVAEGLYKEKGSKFMAFLFPVESEDEVRTILDKLKTEHKKARHFCFAFRIGQEGALERANDAGEPNGSAGLPILNQLHSANLTNVLLVVVRYFGGTKLGLSGLVTAYKEAAKDAIEGATLKKYVMKTIFRIVFDISEMGSVERLINSENLEVTAKEFGPRCCFSIACKLIEAERVRSLLALINLEFKE